VPTNVVSAGGAATDDDGADGVGTVTLADVGVDFGRSYFAPWSNE